MSTYHLDGWMKRLWERAKIIASCPTRTLELKQVGEGWFVRGVDIRRLNGGISGGGRAVLAGV